MNRQELLKEANYTLQRGNRELAQKLLAELLTKYPKDEAGWMLLARAVTQKERKIECYERVIKLNPRNLDAKQELVRIQFPGHTYKDRQGIVPESSGQISTGFKRFMQISFGLIAVLLVLTSTTFVIAKTNPQSPVAKLWTVVTLPQVKAAAPEDIASNARDDLAKKYPQYSPLVDALIEFAVNNAEDGMDGAPARPGGQISASDQDGQAARSILDGAIPQPGSSAFVTLTEAQVTSWLSMEMRNSPDVPIRDVQVYFMNGQIQAWGMIQGQNNSTSALATGTVNIDANGMPAIKIDSFQIGQKQAPSALLSQAESWLNQMLVEEINKQAPGLQIIQISIGNGVITVSGSR